MFLVAVTVAVNAPPPPPWPPGGLNGIGEDNTSQALESGSSGHTGISF